MCFFGDGTTNIGAFHEALNFSVVWKLPVVFVCENNLYMEYTPIHDVTAVEHPAADRASAYGLEPVVIDGNDVDEVYRTAQRALELARARAAARALIEADDVSPQRPLARRPGQVPARRRARKVARRDPLPRYRARLLEMGINEPTLKDIEAEAMTQSRRSDRDRAQRVAAAALDASRQGRLGGRRLGMAELTYRDAVAAGIAQEMARDENVVFLGEDVAAAGGVFKATVGLLEKFGPKRVRDTPDLGAGDPRRRDGRRDDGLAPDRRDHVLRLPRGVLGHRRERDREDALHDERPDHAAARHPLRRTARGSRFGAQHSQSVENWAMAIPGIKVVAPAFPADVKGLLAAAIRDSDPVLVLRAEVAVRDERRSARRRARRRARQGERAARGQGLHDRRARSDGAQGARRPPRS